MKPVKATKQPISGIAVKPHEIAITINLLDKSSRGVVSAAALRSRVAGVPGYAAMSVEDWKSIIPGHKAMTAGSLSTAILDNSVSLFDPVEAAFKALVGPDGGDHLPLPALRQVLSTFAPNPDAAPTAEDMTVLLAAADADRDGKIGLSDFRRLVAYTGSRQPTDAELCRLPPGQ